MTIASELGTIAAFIKVAYGDTDSGGVTGGSVHKTTPSAPKPASINTFNPTPIEPPKPLANPFTEFQNQNKALDSQIEEASQGLNTASNRWWINPANMWSRSQGQWQQQLDQLQQQRQMSDLGEQSLQAVMANPGLAKQMGNHPMGGLLMAGMLPGNQQHIQNILNNNAYGTGMQGGPAANTPSGYATGGGNYGGGSYTGNAGAGTGEEEQSLGSMARDAAVIIGAGYGIDKALPYASKFAPQIAGMASKIPGAARMQQLGSMAAKIPGISKLGPGISSVAGWSMAKGTGWLPWASRWGGGAAGGALNLSAAPALAAYDLLRGDTASAGKRFYDPEYNKRMGDSRNPYIFRALDAADPRNFYKNVTALGEAALDAPTTAYGMWRMPAEMVGLDRDTRQNAALATPEGYNKMQQQQASKGQQIQNAEVERAIAEGRGVMQGGKLMPSKSWAVEYKRNNPQATDVDVQSAFQSAVYG